MSNLNKALLIGRLTKDPEMRYTPSGTAVTNFSIATNRWSTGPDGERKEFTDYHNIVAYNAGKRNLAEIVAQYTRKGALVFIEGRIQTRSWEGQDGQKRRTTEIIANDVQFLDSRSSGGGGTGGDGAPARSRPAPSGCCRTQPSFAEAKSLGRQSQLLERAHDLPKPASNPRPDAAARARRPQHEPADDRPPRSGVCGDPGRGHGGSEARLQDQE